jgi:hypothetical protein
MPDENPYQSPTAEPIRSPRPPVDWLKVARAVTYNLLMGAAMLLLWYGFFVHMDVVLFLVAIALLFFTNADPLKLRPAEVRATPFLSIDWAIWISGFVGAVAPTYSIVDPIEQRRLQTAAIFCWVFVFFMVRDGLYAAGVLPRTTEPRIVPS